MTTSISIQSRKLVTTAPLRSIKQTAEHLNVSEKTVRRLIKRGDLRSVRVGNSIRIAAEDLAAYLNP